MDGRNIARTQTEGEFRGTRGIIYVVVIDGFSPNWAGSRSLIMVTKFKPRARLIPGIPDFAPA